MYLFIFNTAYTTDAYVCLLKRRWDSVAAFHRWSMPWDERCRCLGVVAPEEANPSRTCPLVRGDIREPSVFWFTDNKTTLTTRSNWKPHILNKLLDRAEYCSEYPMVKTSFFSFLLLGGGRGRGRKTNRTVILYKY